MPSIRSFCASTASSDEYCSSSLLIVSAYSCCFSPCHHTPLWKAFLCLLDNHLWVLGGCCYVPLKPSLLQTEQGQFPQPFFTRHMFQSSSAWGPSPGLAAIYKHLSSVRGPKNGCRTLDRISQVLRTGGQSFPWTSYMQSCCYTLGGFWPALLSGQSAGLCPACQLPAPIGPSQQRCSPASQVPASVIIPEMSQCCDHMQSSGSSCLFPGCMHFCAYTWGGCPFTLSYHSYVIPTKVLL